MPAGAEVPDCGLLKRPCKRRRGSAFSHKPRASRPKASGPPAAITLRSFQNATTTRDAEACHTLVAPVYPTRTRALRERRRVNTWPDRPPHGAASRARTHRCRAPARRPPPHARPQSARRLQHGGTTCAPSTERCSADRPKRPRDGPDVAPIAFNPARRAATSAAGTSTHEPRPPQSDAPPARGAAWAWGEGAAALHALEPSEQAAAARHGRGRGSPVFLRGPLTFLRVPLEFREFHRRAQLDLAQERPQSTV